MAILVDVVDEGPAARAWKGTRVGAGVEAVQQVGAELDERTQVVVNLMGHGPLVPVVDVDVVVQVHEAVGQRRGHGMDHRAVTDAVASSHDEPALRQLVLADLAVEDELVGGGLDRLRRAVDLVQEQHTLALGGQEVGGEPLHVLLDSVDHGEALEVDRVEQGQAHVAQLELHVFGDLGHDVGFADARRTPDHRWAALGHELGEGSAQ